MKFTVIVEKGPTSYGAYVPDLPGCIAAGETREEVISLIKEAIADHLDLMVKHGGDHSRTCQHGLGGERGAP